MGVIKVPYNYISNIRFAEDIKASLMVKTVYLFSGWFKTKPPEIQ